MPINKQVVKTGEGSESAAALPSEPNNNATLESYRLRKLPVVFAGISLAVIAVGGLWGIVWFAQVFTDSKTWVSFVIGASLNLFLLVAVIAQACIYWAQRNLMRQQWNAMQQALAEARQQTKIAGDSLVISQQAYVGIHSVRADLQADKAITITIENIGKAPAKDIRLVVTVVRLLAKEAGSREKSWQMDWKTTQLFPGNLKLGVWLELGDWLTDHELLLVTKADAFLHIEGRISYSDGFGHKEPTRFVVTYVKGEWVQFPEDAATKTQPDKNWKKI